MHHGAMDGIPLPPGLGGALDPLETVLGPFPCVRLRGLPHDASLEDVLIFFQGLVVLDVVLQGSGEAFVVFSNPMDFQMALQRDRQSIRMNMIEVLQGKRGEYYSAIAAQQWQIERQEQQMANALGEDDEREHGASLSGFPTWSAMPSQTLTASLGSRGYRKGNSQAGRGLGGQQVRRTGGGIQVGEHTGYLRMRGLPFSSTKEEIVAFFEGYSIIPDSVVLTYRSDGRATGEGYLQFETPDDAKNAMSLHRNTMGSRYIELFISNREEHARAFARFSDR